MKTNRDLVMSNSLSRKIANTRQLLLSGDRFNMIPVIRKNQITSTTVSCLEVLNSYLENSKIPNFVEVM